jgi:hypothetical protein
VSAENIYTRRLQARGDTGIGGDLAVAGNATVTGHLTGTSIGSIGTHGFWVYNDVTYVTAIAAGYTISDFGVAGTVTGAWAQRQGGTGATVNIGMPGGDLRSADLSLTTTNWTSFGGLQNTTFTSTGAMNFSLATVTGNVTQIGIQITYLVTG